MTALAAKLYLGEQFQFQTSLIPLANDDLQLRFSGDPTLTSKDIRKLFSQYKAQYGNEILGDIWLDNSAFSGYQKASGWPWDITGVCYSAPSAAISLDHNCVQGAIYSDNAVGKLTRVHVPDFQPITVTSTAKITAKQENTPQSPQPECQLELTPSPDNHYLISGCLQQRKKPLPLKFAIQNTEKYSQFVISRELKSLNIQWRGHFKLGQPHSESINQAITHHSAPLPELLSVMLKKSDNLYADNITKTIGARFYQQAGTFSNGIAAIKAILQQHHIDLSNAVIADGSGLSRNNRLTAQQLSDVMSYIYHHDQQLKLIDLLPVSGVSGTLKYRKSINQAPFKGQIQGKSGTIYGSHNLVSIVTSKNGEKYLVVQLVSNYFPSQPEEPRNWQLINFEQSLYRSLINH
ncbi:D-alanyl-D-alanine carboxypeptidase/D-alanyl-D-alanine-endopeptidase [Vibrio sp. SS-MA-C1-2]|nr:D-alanyl-D-alanine carboxypeptidase/D-alanyl-D-alanine-endopeptidase [Vibrio sp. SS-MA-C1-2]